MDRYLPPMPKGHVRAADQIGHPYFDKVAERVRNARLAAGWSRIKLSEETSITPAWRLAEKEYNLRPFSLIELRRISLVLGVDIRKFFEVEREGGEDFWPVPLGEEQWYWRVTAPDEKLFLESYRKMPHGWQRRALLLMTQSMVLAQNTAGGMTERGVGWTDPEAAARLVTESAFAIWPENVPLPGPNEEEDEGLEASLPEDVAQKLPAEDLAREAELEAHERANPSRPSLAEEKELRRGWTLGQAPGFKVQKQGRVRHPLEGVITPPKPPPVIGGGKPSRYALIEAAAQRRRLKEEAQLGSGDTVVTLPRLEDVEGLPGGEVATAGRSGSVDERSGSVEGFVSPDWSSDVTPSSTPEDSSGDPSSGSGSDEDYGVVDIGAEADD